MDSRDQSESPTPPDQPLEEVEDPAAGHGRLLAELVEEQAQRQRAQAAAIFGFDPAQQQHDEEHDADPVHEELAALEARVVEAERAAREVDAQACEAANRLELASSEFASLPPEELDATGNPRPKTTAATLAAEIQKLKTPPVSWSRRAEQAHTTARRARLELDRFEGANVATIVKAEEHLGREAGDNLRAQLTGVIAAIDNWHHT